MRESSYSIRDPSDMVNTRGLRNLEAVNSEQRLLVERHGPLTNDTDSLSPCLTNARANPLPSLSWSYRRTIAKSLEQSWAKEHLARADGEIFQDPRGLIPLE